MPASRHDRLILFLLLAVVGALLCFVPPYVLQQYETIAKYGRTWVILYFVVVGIGAAMLAGLGIGIVWNLWQATRRKQARLDRSRKNPSELSRDERDREVRDNLAAVADLQADVAISPEVKARLEALTRGLEEKREAQRLEIVAFGTISSGKSSLLNALAGRDAFQTDEKGGTTVQRQEVAWRGDDRVVLVDTPGLGEIDGAEHISISAESAKDADIVLMVVDGPLRQSEHQLLARLGEMEKRVLVCLNKADWYDAREQASLKGQLAEQLEGIVRPEDILAVRSRPTKRARTRVLSDGAEEEELVEVPPDIGPLAKRLLEVVKRNGQDILLANVLLKSRGMVETARTQVSEALDKQAWHTVERYTWGAGGAAALSPLPVVDLLAGSALTTKMVLDLARIYREDVDSKLVVTLLGQLGKNLLAILGVSAAAPAVTAAVASMLKTIPGAGYLVGGLLQGLVQALVTRWIGAVFIQYFKQEMQLDSTGLANVARREWDRLTSIPELVKLVRDARQKLLGADKE
jgi:small GTP-binding protein